MSGLKGVTSMFIFNISRLKNDVTASLDINVEAKEKSHIKFGRSQYKLLSPIKLVGTFSSITQGIIEFKGSVTTTLQLQCGRCMEFKAHPMEVDFTQRFSGHPDHDKDDFGSIEGNTIDMTDIIMEEIFVNVPVNVLCDEDCKGLCSECGANLNEGKCHCDDSAKIDPRFSALKDLFNE